MSIASKIKSAALKFEKSAKKFVSQEIGLNQYLPEELVNSVKRVLGKEGLGSWGGVREAGKGVLRTATTVADLARKSQPAYYIQPKQSREAQNKFVDNIQNRLAPRGNEVQKSPNKGFSFLLKWRDMLQ